MSSFIQLVYVNKKVCRHMNLSLHIRNTTTSPDKIVFSGSLRHLLGVLLTVKPVSGLGRSVGYMSLQEDLTRCCERLWEHILSVKNRKFTIWRSESVTFIQNWKTHMDLGSSTNKQNKKSIRGCDPLFLYLWDFIDRHSSTCFQVFPLDFLSISLFNWFRLFFRFLLHLFPSYS